jgi:guanylate kinase
LNAEPPCWQIPKNSSGTHEPRQEAHYFQYVIPNHDGEDSENWDAFYYPLGDARLALLAFVSLLAGKVSAAVEHWEEELISVDGFGNSRESGIRGCCYVGLANCH